MSREFTCNECGDTFVVSDAANLLLKWKPTQPVLCMDCLASPKLEAFKLMMGAVGVASTIKNHQNLGQQLDNDDEIIWPEAEIADHLAEILRGVEQVCKQVGLEMGEIVELSGIEVGGE